MSRTSEIRIDACQHGLVTCHRDGSCPDYLRSRERNAQAWSYLLRDANAARRAAVAALSPYEYSLESKAREAGLVPHGVRQLPDPTCDIRQAHLRRAAALIGFEYRHPAEYVFHATAWAVAR